jgi:hypothetical protein
MFQVIVLRLHFRLKQAWQRPVFIGSALRGGFGQAIADLACTEPALLASESSCRTCPKQQACAYPAVFKRPEENGQSKAPHYALRPPVWGSVAMDSGEHLVFEQVLYDDALAQLPVILHAWSRFQFDDSQPQLEFVKAEQLDLQGDVIASWVPEVPVQGFKPLSPLLDFSAGSEMKIRFLSPVILRKQGQDKTRTTITAKDIVESARQRSPLKKETLIHLLPFNELEKSVITAWAASIDMQADLYDCQWDRNSRNHGKKIPMKGVIGELTLSGNLEPFSASLYLAQFTGLGKYANYGAGHIQIDTIR